MNKETRVGLMFAVALTILAAMVYLVGNFKESLDYKIRFFRVNGLAVDSPVQFNGVPIGRVTKIVLEEQTEPGERVAVIVSIAVHKSLKNHIRESTVADIKAMGVLGDKSVLLLTRDYSAEILPEDSFINQAKRTLDVDELLKQGSDLVTDVTIMSENLKKILEQLANQDGVIQKLINDRELGEKLTHVLSQVLDKIENGDSLLSLAVNDSAFRDKIHADFLHITSQLVALLDRASADENLLSLLIADGPFKEETRASVSSLLGQANAYMERVSTSNGLMNRLLEDEEYGARIAANLDKATFHLASILEKIDKGEGTVGLLLNDPSIYQGAYEVVYGLQHSGLSKWYIQKKQKKGEQMLEKNKHEKPQSQGDDYHEN